jgi:hypothetical protein
MPNRLQKSIGFVAAAVAAEGMSLSAVQPSDLLMYQKGPVVLKPQFEVTETLNDNISYRHEQKEADLITTLTPGLALQLGRRDFNYFDLIYRYDRVIYADHTEFSADQHHIAARLRFRHNRLTIDGSDTIDFLSSPVGGGYSATVNTQSGEAISGVSGRKIDRGNFYDQYRLSWDASERTDLYVQAVHSFVDYQDNLPLYDSRTLSGTLGFEYHPFVKAYFFGEVYYGKTENEGNVPSLFPYPIASFIGLFLGARGQITENLRGTAKAGYEHRYYSGRSETLNAPVVEISLDQQLTDRSLITAGYSRRQNESVQLVRSPYTTDSLYASWLQQIGADGRLRSVVRASYLLSTFDETSQQTSERTDQILSASLTISYDIKLWMRAFGSYSFEHLDSNERSIVDYNVNRLTLGLQIGY